MSPYTPSVDATRKALTAAKCLPLHYIGLLTEQVPTSDSLSEGGGLLGCVCGVPLCRDGQSYDVRGEFGDVYDSAFLPPEFSVHILFKIRAHVFIPIRNSDSGAR